MTDQLETQEHDDIQFDVAVLAAYEAASCVVHYTHEPDDEEENVIPMGWWPCLGDQDKADVDQDTVCHNVLAPFVRRHPTAPPEALYRDAHAKKVHTGDVNGWATLPVCYRLAYQTFRETLLRIDAEFAAEAALRASQAPAMPRARFVDASQSILEKHGAELERERLQPARRSAPRKQPAAEDPPTQEPPTQDPPVEEPGYGPGESSGATDQMSDETTTAETEPDAAQPQPAKPPPDSPAEPKEPAKKAAKSSKT